ncbi:MAG TPA: fatty acyl-AMP ligase [Ktedonosporobacter sp.]|jgi:acyl-CoA synthetase (AMP-forming)/AMP-acid ligase II|nr:fatty acyl-AMP ligase [Ktedonosporobacter sp.]
MKIDISYPLVKTSTFVDILTKRAQRQPEQIAYTFLNFGKEADASLTYKDLHRQARSIAIKLQSLGYQGKPALLLYPSGLEYIAAFFGCLYAGAIAVPIYPPDSDRLLPRIQAIINDTQATVALTTAKTQDDILRRFMHLPELQRLHWITTDDIPVSLNQHWQKPELTEDSLAFLQYTSGSTSTPKGVMVSHGNLLHNSEANRIQMGLDEKDRGVSWLPIFHDLGLIIGILQPLYTGYHTVLMAPTAFIQRPLRWLQAMADYKATVSYAPNFAYDLCIRRTSPEDRAKLDLSHWQVALNGAEPVRSETLREFVATFEPSGFHPDTFMPAYGLAEATAMVSGKQRRAPFIVKHVNKTLLEQHYVVDTTPDDQNAQLVVSCGKVVAGQQVIIVHPESLTRCQPEEIGEIWVAGGSIAQGYFGKAEETSNTFHAYLPDSGEGPFLRTGDLGFMQNGEVFITGRLKDLIIIKGRNHYPQDIEYVVEQSSPIIRAGCSVAFSIDAAHEERLVVVAEVRIPQNGLTPGEIVQKIDETTKAIRRNVAETHEITVHQVVLVKVGEVPKTSSGKLQRRACRTRYLAGSLKEWNQ